MRSKPRLPLLFTGLGATLVSKMPLLRVMWRSAFSPLGKVVVTLDGGVTEPRVALRHTLLIKAHLTENPLPLVHCHDVAAQVVEQLRVGARTLLLVVAGPRGRLYVRKLLGHLLT